MVTVSEGISLRVMTFTPAVDMGYPTILFVAGWITQLRAWKSVLRELTKDFRVVYAETREKVSSGVSRREEYSIEAIGHDLVGLVEQLGLPPGWYVPFGSSLGATAIVDCYSALTSKPLAAILVSPNTVFRVPRSWMIIVTMFYPGLYALIKPAVKWYLKNFRLDVESDREQYDKYCSALDAADPWKLKKAVLSVSKYAIWDRLDLLDCPTLLVGASRDVLHEPENFRAMVSKIRNATTVDLETNKRTHSEEVAHETRAFLTRILQGSGAKPDRP